ncbi:MAG: DNA methyltransferase [Candidatus Omnitrophota bacterium]|jgi:DNA modification methylase
MNIDLRHGDCCHVMSSMADKSVDLILTDPPYDWSEDKKFIYHEQFKRICRGAIIVFCPPENLWQPKCDQTLFWVKPISTKNTSKSYSRFVEVIQIWNGTTWNADGHWSQYTNVFTDLVDSKVHPFKKPDSMIIRLLKNHSNENDTVFDGFFGSGTVPKMCKLHNRNCIASEINTELFNQMVD